MYSSGRFDAVDTDIKMLVMWLVCSSERVMIVMGKKEETKRRRKTPHADARINRDNSMTAKHRKENVSRSSLSTPNSRHQAIMEMAVGMGKDVKQ